MSDESTTGEDGQDGAGSDGRRPYRKRRRAQLEAETRLRITEAAVKLHGSVGPARTTISAVAREAGVQRATVYRHFPDEEALFHACSTHYFTQHPLPDPAAWAEIADPDERLRRALESFYAFFEETREMLDRTLRDAHLVPSMDQAAERFLSYFAYVRTLLMRGRRERGRRRERVAAAIGHVLSFPTWWSLVAEQGLEAEEAVALAMGMVRAAAADPVAGFALDS